MQALKSRAAPCIVVCYRHILATMGLRMDAISMLWMLVSAVIRKLVVSLYWPRTSGREICLPVTIQERCPSASSVAVSDDGILTFFYFDGQTSIRVRDIASPRASFPTTWIHCSILNARHFHGISRRAPYCACVTHHSHDCAMLAIENTHSSAAPESSRTVNFLWVVSNRPPLVTAKSC